MEAGRDWSCWREGIWTRHFGPQNQLGNVIRLLGLESHRYPHLHGVQGLVLSCRTKQVRTRVELGTSSSIYVFLDCECFDFSSIAHYRPMFSFYDKVLRSYLGSGRYYPMIPKPSSSGCPRRTEYNPLLSYDQMPY